MVKRNAASRPTSASSCTSSETSASSSAAEEERSMSMPTSTPTTMPSQEVQPQQPHRRSGSSSTSSSPPGRRNNEKQHCSSRCLSCLKGCLRCITYLVCGAVFIIQSNHICETRDVFSNVIRTTQDSWMGTISSSSSSSTSDMIVNNKTVENVQVSFTQRCADTTLGDVDQSLVYGVNVTYCYPRHGTFQDYLDAVQHEDQPPLIQRNLRDGRKLESTLTEDEDEDEDEEHQDDPNYNQTTTTKPSKTIFLLTSPKDNHEHRNAIRQAWGKQGWVFFVVAFAQTWKGATELADEMDTYGDIIWVNVPNVPEDNRGIQRRMASLHAVQTHLTLKENNEQQNDNAASAAAASSSLSSIPFDTVYTGHDNIHMTVSLFHTHMTMLKPDYYGICLMPRRHPSLNLKPQGRGIYPPKQHAASTAVGTRLWSKSPPRSNPVKMDKFGRPQMIASSVGYAMSTKFIKCAFKQTMVETENLELTSKFHEDALVAWLAYQCGLNCVDSDYSIIRYESDLVVQYRVKTREQFFKLHKQYTGISVEDNYGQENNGEKEEFDEEEEDNEEEQDDEYDVDEEDSEEEERFYK